MDWTVTAGAFWPLTPWATFGVLVSLTLLAMMWVWALTEEPDEDEKTRPLTPLPPEPEPERVWVTTFDNGPTQIEDLDGVSWHEAPIPAKRHKCAPQTRGWTGYFTQVFRCACGAISGDLRYWDERNTRVES